ncbi:redoxin domain-containing protein [Salinibacterium sp. SWN248]|uniref:redoxin domain-containing protein n=1 Tax=Salinibacterium sp. SWN248 TaxID=2792056 RepID=UPI0018CF141A|nr:redoxin domain-containing protein [Salinibacterium sp. SWN248]MBH0022982.1 redoxin domain-containing protein [Salinibacterium sp. SWN248]
MQTIKRVYGEVTAALALGVITLVILRAITEAQPWWLAAALPWVAYALYLALLMTRVVVVQRRHPWVQLAVSGVAIFAAILAGPLAVLVAVLGLAVILGYNYWYSVQHVSTEPVRVDEPLPLFPLTTVDGAAVDSSVFTQQPHVLMFIRGNWCPFCMAQVAQIADQYRELDRRGVAVAIISPQKPADTVELSQRFDIPVNFYIDTDGAAAAALDLVQPGGTPVIFSAGAPAGGDTVVPTVIITDASGTVLWAEQTDNHRVRPEPTTFLDVLDQHGIRAR